MLLASPNRRVFSHFFKGAGFLSLRSTYFLFFCIILFLREWKSFEWSVFLKWTVTASLKAEHICHSTARNCRKSWPGDYYTAECYYFLWGKVFFLYYYYYLVCMPREEKNPDNETEFYRQIFFFFLKSTIVTVVKCWGSEFRVTR